MFLKISHATKGRNNLLEIKILIEHLYFFFHNMQSLQKKESILIA